MQIDAHNHILSLASDADFTKEYGREGSLCIYRSEGRLPTHRHPTDDEWAHVEEEDGKDGFGVIGPDELVAGHPGFDKMIALAISPQWLDGRLIGTVDATDLLGLGGQPHPERCNEYLGACQAARPDEIIGFASVNPAYRGPKAAVITASMPGDTLSPAQPRSGRSPSVPMTRSPARERAMAAALPAGPAPTTRTSQSLIR